MPFMIFSPTSRTCFMRASSSRSAPLADSSALDDLGRARERAREIDAVARVVGQQDVDDTARDREAIVLLLDELRCAGRGMTSATVSAIAAASAIRKNQIFDRNTARLTSSRARRARPPGSWG